MKSYLHHHLLKVFSKKKWLCDNCGIKNKYNLTNKHIRYHCHKCDYDLCFKCFINSSRIMKKKKKSKIKVDLKNIIYTPRNKKTIDYSGMDYDN